MGRIEKSCEGSRVLMMSSSWPRRFRTSDAWPSSPPDRRHSQCQHERNDNGQLTKVPKPNTRQGMHPIAGIKMSATSKSRHQNAKSNDFFNSLSHKQTSHQSNDSLAISWLELLLIAGKLPDCPECACGFVIQYQ